MVDATVNVSGTLGSGGTTTVEATRSGDTTFDAMDGGLVSSDGGGDRDAVNSFAFFGPGAPTTAAAASLATGVLSVDFDVSVPAGATRGLVFFARLDATAGEAIAAAPTFDLAVTGDRERLESAVEMLAEKFKSDRERHAPQHGRSSRGATREVATRS